MTCKLTTRWLPAGTLQGGRHAGLARGSYEGLGAVPGGERRSRGGDGAGIGEGSRD
jgi:hypothetical protein